MSSREDIKELCEGINDLGISDDKETKINIVSSVKQKKNKSNYVLVNNYNSAIMKRKVRTLKAKILNDRSST